MNIKVWYSAEFLAFSGSFETGILSFKLQHLILNSENVLRTIKVQLLYKLMYENHFIDACMVSINMFLRSISKIDDYKMVSVLRLLKTLTNCPHQNES